MIWYDMLRHYAGCDGDGDCDCDGDCHGDGNGHETFSVGRMSNNGCHGGDTSRVLDSSRDRHQNGC